VCGCSFSADSLVTPGTGYGHQLAKKLGWDVQVLARQGCSNGGIRVQIDEVIRQRPTFAIIAPTFHDRIEIPARAAPYDWSKNKETGWNPFLQRFLQDKSILNGYDPAAGIDNVNYKTNPYRMICETIFSLAENYEHAYRSAKIDKDTQAAIKQYINFLYDSNWKFQQDEWIMRDGIMQLFYSGIPFLLVANNLWTNQTVRAAIPDIVPDRYMTLCYEDTPAYATNTWPFTGMDPGYHGAVESQTYLADTYYKVIREQFGIKE
jgi:hypothetical protein